MLWFLRCRDVREASLFGGEGGKAGLCVVISPGSRAICGRHLVYWHMGESLAGVVRHIYSPQEFDSRVPDVVNECRILSRSNQILVTRAQL